MRMNVRRKFAGALPVVAVLFSSAVSQADAEEYAWKKGMVVAEVKRDGQGSLLPLQSYDETIRRGMSFILDDHLSWFKAPETLLDENGKTQMPWVYYSNVQHNGAPFPAAVDRFTSYPAFHHALMIRTLLGYYKYANDLRALDEAVKLADWEIAHSTPAAWAYGNLPYSTYEHKKPGGFRDGSGLMPDKAAIMALAYLDLYEASGKKRFLQAAEAVAETLSLRQRPNGTWPFRVDPKTEKVVEEYTSSVIYAVMLFEKLDELNGNSRYRPYRDKTWNWLVNGPIKTREFRGFYEDIPASPEGRTNYDCLDTIRYLLANRTEENGYLEMAIGLNHWIEEIFLDKIKGFEPAEGIREQLQCNVVMGIHSLNWASMLLELAQATGDEQMRRRAVQTANYTTYYLQPDNRIVVGFEYNQWWYSCHVGVVLYLFDFLEAGSADQSQVRQEKSNVVLILIDDLGWADLGVTGSTYYETPNIDALAREGVFFSNAYAASPVCSPTRASIMTGKYPSRIGMSSHSGSKGPWGEKHRLVPPEVAGNMPLEDITLAEALKEAGYATAHVGKWHLQAHYQHKERTYFPEANGFDINIAGHRMGQPGSYYFPYKSEQHPSTNVPDMDDGAAGDYLTDALTDKAIAFIESHKDKPFFLNLWYYTVHTPINPRKDKLDKYRKKAKALGLDKTRSEARPDHRSFSHANQDSPDYACMVESMDENIGRILKTLKRLELENDISNLLLSAARREGVGLRGRHPRAADCETPGQGKGRAGD
jgi:hypothetical protein